MPPSKRYKYEALATESTMRLILIDPASDERAPLSCSMIQRDRASRPKYIAISYAWENPILSRKLKLRSKDLNLVLKITHNADAVLRQLRALNYTQLLWIDAVCLNQDDEDEKAQQIPLMGSIFGQAKQVFIWLGTADSRTSQLFDFLRKINELPDADHNRMSESIVRLMKVVFHEEKALKDNVFREGARDGFNLFVDFSERPWFSRRWVLQEARLAQKGRLYCGTQCITLQCLAQAARRFQAFDLSDYNIKVMTQLHPPTMNVTLLELLWDFHEARCRDPKDRIASFLGLVSVDQQYSLDYKAHWTKIYQDFYLHMLTKGDEEIRYQLLLHLLEFGSLAQLEDYSLPSWLPDWTKPRRRDLPIQSWIMTTDTFERYPRCIEHHLSTRMTEFEGFVHATCDTSIGDIRIHSVGYVNKFDSYEYDHWNIMQRSMQFLAQIVPIPNPSLSVCLHAIKVMLGVITKFKPFAQSKDNASFKGTFSGNAGLGLRGKRAEWVELLYTINRILQDHHLFRMNPYAPKNGIV